MTKIANPRYCPTAWLDEVNPLGDAPEAFARRNGDQWLLIDPDEETNAVTHCKSDLEQGQIVNFARLTNYDDFTLTIKADGTHYADLPEFDGHPGFRLEQWEYEDSVDDLGDLIRLGTAGQIFDDIANPLPEGTYTVQCWSWRDTIPLRFEPDGDAPKFVPCAGAN